jgi:hypothetical protein
MHHSTLNHSIATADGATHLKIVVVALVAAIMVVTAGIAARLSLSEGTATAGLGSEPAVKVGVVKAGQPVAFTGVPGPAVR